MNDILDFLENFIVKWAELWQYLNTPLSTYFEGLSNFWQTTLYLAWLPLYPLRNLTIIELITTHVAVIFFILVILKIFKMVNPLD